MTLLDSCRPLRVNGTVRILGWTNLVAQIVIVATGGLVRLSASGLGCPSWPSCTPESLITTPEMGFHGVIEFGNRMMTFLLILIALATFISVTRVRGRRDLRWLAFVIGLGIPAQAIIGGVSVMTGLNPFVVGIHFVVSIALVVLATIFVRRSSTTDEPGGLRRISGWPLLFACAIGAAGGLATLLGILTTGSGPHAGDTHAPRNGLNPEVLQHIHSAAAYATVAFTVALLLLLFIHGERTRSLWVLGLLVVEAAQVGTGIVQANTGLPPLLVGVHMVLACVFALVLTTVVMPVTVPVPGPDARGTYGELRPESADSNHMHPVTTRV